jgi:BlaI family penicillinase repressor
MARPPSQGPTGTEIEILQVLWEIGPAELAEVCASLRRRRPVATTTVATMLSLMKEKGLVERSSGPRGYRWKARVSRKAAATGMLRRLMDRIFEGSAGRLVAHLLSEGSLTERERREVLELLREAGRRRPRK